MRVDGGGGVQQALHYAPIGYTLVMAGGGLRRTPSRAVWRSRLSHNSLMLQPASLVGCVLLATSVAGLTAPLPIRTTVRPRVALPARAHGGHSHSHSHAPAWEGDSAVAAESGLGPRAMLRRCTRYFQVGPRREFYPPKADGARELGMLDDVAPACRRWRSSGR